MPPIDKKDLKILELLSEDSRRPFSEIANKIDLSAPTVSSRVERLMEKGIIESRTIDINYKKLDDNTAHLVRISPNDPESVRGNLSSCEFVQSIFQVADGKITTVIRCQSSDLQELLEDEVGTQMANVEDVSVITEKENNRRPPVRTADPEERSSLPTISDD